MTFCTGLGSAHFLVAIYAIRMNCPIIVVKLLFFPFFRRHSRIAARSVGLIVAFNAALHRISGLQIRQRLTVFVVMAIAAAKTVTVRFGGSVFFVIKLNNTHPVL